MANEVTPFEFESCQVRVLTRDGEPWFVLADACRVLEIANPRDAAGRLDDDEKGVVTTDTLGGKQTATIVNESGLYALILTSRKDAARRFKKWVTAVVLPSIRKTGSYGAPATAVDYSDPALMLGMMQHLTARVEAQKSTIAVMQPKVEALDRIAGADGSNCIRDAAKDLQIRPTDLRGWLLANRWVYTRQDSDTLIAYQDKIASGFLEHKVTTGPKRDGGEWKGSQVRITPKGLARIAVLLRKTPEPAV